jgi:sulfide:quinone oxidoreductase
MVEIIQLERDIAVAPQLVEADFATAAQRGFRSVVNIRPDGEAPGQLPSVDAQAAARRHGLEFRYLPVPGMNVTDDDVVAAFARLMHNLPRPILFYCGTGTRCTILWTQAAVRRRNVDEVLATARNAGFDLDFLYDSLIERGDCRMAAGLATPFNGAFAAAHE